MPPADPEKGENALPNTQSRRIALCGVLAALGVALLLAGSALGIGTYAAPMLTCFLLIPALNDYGPATALTQYAATALLGLLLVPDPELSLFYALALGPYPVVRVFLERLRRPVLRRAAKFAWFNLTVAVLYALLLLVFAPPGLGAELFGGGVWYLAVLAGMINLAFWLCDRALAALTAAYRLRRRRRR